MDKELQDLITNLPYLARLTPEALEVFHQMGSYNRILIHNDKENKLVDNYYNNEKRDDIELLESVYKELVKFNLIYPLTQFRYRSRTGWSEYYSELGKSYDIYCCTQ